MAGEAGGDDALAALLREEGAQHDADARLARRVAALLGVRRVAHQQADAGALGELAEARQVAAPMVDRGEVDLEVARVQHDALRRVDGDRMGVGHGMGDRDELDVERPDGDRLAVADRVEVGALGQARLVDPVPGEAEGERRPVDRQRAVAEVADTVAVAEQVLDGADVVLVAVGEDERLDPLGVLPQVGEVGQDQVDPVHVRVGEHQPAVDEHDRAARIVDGALLDRHAVAADLAEPPEEHDAHRSRAAPFRLLCRR